MSRSSRQRNKNGDTNIKKSLVVNEIESKLSLGEWVGAVTTLIVELVLGVNWIRTVSLFLVPIFYFSFKKNFSKKNKIKYIVVSIVCLIILSFGKIFFYQSKIFLNNKKIESLENQEKYNFAIDIERESQLIYKKLNKEDTKHYVESILKINDLLIKLKTTNNEIFYDESYKHNIENLSLNFEECLNIIEVNNIQDDNLKSKVLKGIGDVYFLKGDIIRAIEYKKKEIMYQNQENLKQSKLELLELVSLSGDILASSKLLTEIENIYGTMDNDVLLGKYKHYVTFNNIEEIKKILPDILSNNENILNFYQLFYNSITIINSDYIERRYPYQFIDCYYIYTDFNYEKEMTKAIADNHIGNNYKNFGKNLDSYLMAENYLMKSYDIRKNIFGDNHIITSIAINNLGNLYELMGSINPIYYTKAETLFTKNLEIRKNMNVSNLLGENHYYYAQALSNLAFVQMKLKKFNEAEINYLEAIRLRKKIFGINNSEYLNSVDNYIEMLNLKKAPKTEIELAKKTYY